MKDPYIKRVVRRRKSRRPANVVDRIRADNSPEFKALLARAEPPVAAPGVKVPRRAVTLEIGENFVVMVEGLAARQGISPERFMEVILHEGLCEAYLELSSQVNEAGRKARIVPPSDIMPPF